jgi:hypothetical protein
MSTATAVPAIKKRKQSGGLRCDRCSGLMVPETLSDWTAGNGLVDWPGWRCVGCGERVDPLILLNRYAGPGPRLRSGLIRSR